MNAGEKQVFSLENRRLDGCRVARKRFGPARKTAPEIIAAISGADAMIGSDELSGALLAPGKLTEM